MSQQPPAPLRWLAALAGRFLALLKSVAAAVRGCHGRAPQPGQVDLDDRTVLITGGNSGIGLEAAVGLARLGARVVITARDAERGEAARAEIVERSGNAAVEVLALDLADLASVRECARAFLDRHDRLDVLVNNAGATHSERQLTTDGLELTLQGNHLGHVLLTDLLLDRLTASAPARVVVVSSAAHRQVRALDLDELGASGHYVGLQQYGRTKLMNLLFARELARRLERTGVTVNALHPGTIRSGFGMDGDARGVLAVLLRIARPFMRTPKAGARTIVYLAASPAVAGVTGRYWDRCRPRRPSRLGRDDAIARGLWDRSRELVGLEPVP